MELKEFITETITQICTGVRDAQCKCKGVIVNPSLQSGTPKAGKDGSYKSATRVSFRVSLQSDEIVNGKNRIGVFLPYIALGKETSKAQDNSSLASVSFDVFVTFL